MQIYFSWSGETSYRIALSLRELINTIFPRLDLWVPPDDIQDGKRWSSKLTRYLDETSIGVVCVDPTNYLSRWLHFEAGAIAKSIENENIRLVYFGLTAEDIQGPLAKFDGFNIKKDEILTFLEVIRSNMDHFTISYMELRANFDLHWTSFESKLAKLDVESIPAQVKSTQPFDFKTDDSRAVEYLDGVEEKLLQLLFVNNGIDEDKVSNLVYLSRGQCQRYLIDMEKKNLVWSNLNMGVRFWYITDLGKKYLPGIYQL